MKPKEEEQSPVIVKGLKKSFGKQKVLNGIDLTLQKGETVAVLGRSGTGKSVLLKLLIGLQKPDAGSIQIEGQEVTGLERDKLDEIRKKVGFLFQQAALYDSLTVEQNVAFPLSRHSDKSEAEQRTHARDLLARVGMKQDLDKMPSEISGGMQKRVGLARALALDPEIVLFDEPTAGLDPITAREIGDLILQLKNEQHMTSLVVTHDLHSARYFSDRVVVVHEGKIKFDGSFEELEKSQDEFVKEFLRDAA